ncbi:MAG: hypothetical protein QNL06_02875, partial [Pontimonas sp.]
RDLEASLGSGKKVVAENEQETVIIQRRGLRYPSPLAAAHAGGATDLEALRPATPGALTPDHIDEALGRTLISDVDFHDIVTPDRLGRS